MIAYNDNGILWLTKIMLNIIEYRDTCVNKEWQQYQTGKCIANNSDTRTTKFKLTHKILRDAVAVYSAGGFCLNLFMQIGKWLFPL